MIKYTNQFMLPFSTAAASLLLTAFIAAAPSLAEENSRAELKEETQSQEARKEETAKSDEPKITLRVGDPAPPLLVDEWMQGKQISEYSKDKFYIVEFWATWCIPCIRAMPHLSEISKQYADDGLEVVAFTSGASNPRDAVKAFVDKRGKDFHFRFAFSESDETNKSFMQAAGKQAIPCSFVIDREGKVAYIGLPHDLDYVVSRVANGKWRGQDDVDELADMNGSIASLVGLAATDIDKATSLVAHIERVNPKRTLSPDFAFAKIVVLCHAKRLDEAKAAIEEMKPRMIESKEWTPLTMSAALLASKQFNPDGIHKEFAESVLKEARDTVEDWMGLYQVGLGYQMAGNNEVAIECMEAAIEVCKNDASRELITRFLEKLK